MQKIKIDLYFSKESNPLEEIEYEKRISEIKDYKTKETIFCMENVEVPKSWNQLSTDILASKYCHKQIPGRQGETSAKEVVSRICQKITDYGQFLGYFQTDDDADNFEKELQFLLINQYAAFNSPVWFNCGLDSYGILREAKLFYWDPIEKIIKKTKYAYFNPQCAACFLQSIDDSMEGIHTLLANEAKLFKYGSGTGTNFSKLRSKYESISGGGKSSGLMSFLKIFDVNTGAVKSGGVTRRAAKMVVLNIDHPEIEEFINWKSNEEKKARILIAGGLPNDFNGEAYQTISGQNSNNSVRVTDEFMKSVEEDKEWWTKEVVTHIKHKKYQAKDLWNMMCQAAWECADPGIQFHDTINNWNTIPNTAEINTTNPCSEICQPDDTSCNLASINLLKFYKDGKFDFESFGKAIDLLILAQDIIVDLSSYPTEKIAYNTHRQRALGLGFANLGTLLMCMGKPYDSINGRYTASEITSFMTARAYQMSAIIASKLEPFMEYSRNKDEMLKILEKHRSFAKNGTIKEWDIAIKLGSLHGFRNSQVTCVAPTGTIGLLMGCDTTGIEPEFSLIKYKTYSGGGSTKIINQSVSSALKNLKYSEEEINKIIQQLIDNNGNIEKTNLKEIHYPIFDCAVPAADSDRAIDPMGHVLMMAAVQPFISESISKTVNMPNSSTAEDISNIYMQAWKLGLKSIAIYRDGSKSSQPLNALKKSTKKGPSCTECGTETIRNGTCFKCPNCGTSMGCS